MLNIGMCETSGRLGYFPIHQKASAFIILPTIAHQLLRLPSLDTSRIASQEGIDWLRSAQRVKRVNNVLTDGQSLLIFDS